MTEKYYDMKKQIGRVYSSLLSDIRVDKNDGYISPKNMKDIQESIIAFMKRIEDLQVEFSESFSGNTNNYKDEKKWILEFSNSFVKTLNGWLDFHQTELGKVTDVISDIESDKQSLIDVLYLRKKTVELQIEQIKKIRTS